VRRVVKRETGRLAGVLGLSQSRLRDGQDLSIAIEPYHETIRTDGARDACRVPTGSDRPIDDHEPRAEIERRQHFL
jgi:hypothetical protein